MEEYKKSYKFLIGYLILWSILIVGSCFLFGENVELAMRFSTNICILGIALLTWIIYKKDTIYWYAGVEFEDALKAGKERRMIYAEAHKKSFCRFAVGFLVFSCISHLCQFPYMVDFGLGFTGLLIVAIGTIKIKL